MPLKIYKRGEVWHYRGTVAGRRLRGSTKTTDRERALQIKANIEAKAWKRDLDGPSAVLTFTQAVTLYEAAGKQTRFLSKIHTHWKGTLVKDITPGGIRQSAIKLFPNATAATRNRQVIVPTQAVINHAAEMELCNRIRVKRFPVPRVNREAADWEWVQAFMGGCLRPHLAALACFMFLTGARITEALSVQWSDIDFERRTAVIRQGKLGGEARVAHLPQPLIVALANIDGRKGSVFKYTTRNTAKPMWRRAISRAGIRPLSYHALRHGFATGLLHSGVDPITVAKRGGWKSAQHVFSTYGHAMEDTTVTDRLIDTKSTQAVEAEKKSA